MHGCRRTRLAKSYTFIYTNELTREGVLHPRPARFWLFMCLSVERYDTHTRAPDHSHLGTVTSAWACFRGVTRSADTVTVTDLHCTHCVPSTQKCPHATRPRAAERSKTVRKRAAFYWQSHAPQRRPKSPTSADLLDRDPLPMSLGGDYDDAGLPRRPNHAPPGRARRKGRSVRTRTWLGWG